MTYKNGIYLWRDQKYDGTPISNDVEINDLISFCNDQNIQFIAYDNWGTGLPDAGTGSGLQDYNFLEKFVCKATRGKVEVEALYSDHIRFNDVITYHNQLPRIQCFVWRRFPLMACIQRARCEGVAFASAN